MAKKKLSDTLIITKKFTTASEFSQFIEKEAVEKKQGLMESIIDFCEKNDIDIEAVAKLITRSLKEKIRIEAEDLHMIKRKTTQTQELPL
jgi:hypothetical protein